MKKLLLICCLMVATNMLVSGQTQLSKSDFTAKVSQLNTLLVQNKGDDAKATWEDVHKIMLAELTELKHKVSDANLSNKDKEHFYEVMHKQKAIYRELIKARTDMAGNKAAVIAKLNEFGTRLL